MDAAPIGERGKPISFYLYFCGLFLDYSDVLLDGAGLGAVAHLSSLAEEAEGLVMEEAEIPVVGSAAGAAASEVAEQEEIGNESQSIPKSTR